MQATGTMTGYAGQTVAMTGAGSMILYDCIMTGVGSMTAQASIQAESAMSGTGFMSTLASWCYANVELGALACIGGDVEDFAYGNGTFQPLNVSAEEGAYIPQAQVLGYGNLPWMLSSGIVKDVDVGAGNMALAPLEAIGGDYEYGFGSGELEPLWSIGVFGKEYEVSMASWAYILDEISTEKHLVIVFTSTGEISTTFTTSKLILQEMLSTMEASSLFTILGVYGAELLSTGLMNTLAGTVVDGKADLDEFGQVWVVNMETGASSQYEQYGYNSYFERDGVYYGIAGNGIYKLEGDDDIGNPIQSLADFGRHNFGIDQKKSITDVYLGVASSGKLYLKTVADGVEYTYQMRSSTTDLANNRVDIGKGLRGNYWSLVMENPDGYSHDLESIHFEPIPLSRKI